MIKLVAFGLIVIFAVASAHFDNYGNDRRFGNRPSINVNQGVENRRGGNSIAGTNGNGQVGDLTFLANVTDPAVRAKFQALYFNHTLNETTRAAAVEALVFTLDSGVQAAYAKWKADQVQQHAEWEALLSAQIANLTALTDQLHDGVYAIRNNASITNEEKILIMPSEFEKLFKGVQQTMNGLYYVGGEPHPENIGDGEYPNIPEYPGNYPDYPNYPEYPFGGSGGRPGPGGPGGPGPAWPPRGGPRGGIGGPGPGGMGGPIPGGIGGPGPGGIRGGIVSGRRPFGRY